MSLVWNAINPTTGHLITDKFSVSSFAVISGKLVDFACDNCITFANSLLDPRIESIGGLCPHKSLIPKVLDVIQSDTETIWPHDAFKHFVSCQFRKGVGCQLLDNQSHLKYFVLVTTADSRASRTTEHATCILRPVDGLPWVKCNEMRCTKGKMRLLKRATSLNELCVHLRFLLTDESCQAELKACGVQFHISNKSQSQLDPDDTDVDNRDESDSDDDSDMCVSFDTTSKIWKPVSPFTFPSIPQQPSEVMKRHIQRRKCGEGILRDTDGSLLFSEDGYLTGEPCVPSTSVCTNCNEDLNMLELQCVGTFKLRTYLGCVQRSQHIKICSCGRIFRWDPVTEFVHVINDGNEGGQYNIHTFTGCDHNDLSVGGRGLCSRVGSVVA